MSQGVNLICKNVTGYGASECRSLPCSGVSGSAVTMSSCSSRGEWKIYSRIKIGPMKCASRAESFVVKASSSGRRRNPDFPRQNKQGSSRNRNRKNEDRESFENHDESELLASKNGPLLSLSSAPKTQATAVPGLQEEEIVKLFTKIQAQLRENAAVTKDKVEASEGNDKNRRNLNALIKILKKHAIEEGNKNVSSGGFGLYQTEQNRSHIEDTSSSFFKSNNEEKNHVQEPNASSLARPPSNFRRRSPVPQVKYQPIISGGEPVNSTGKLNLSGERNIELEKIPEPVQEPELDLESEQEEEAESESESESEQEPSYPAVFDELSEDEASDVDDIDEGDDKQQQIEHEDLSSLKLMELKAIAKSRGVKGFSRMKKGDLVELLSGGLV